MPTEEKIKQLMNDHGTPIFRICFLYLKDYHLAEDAAQDTFIKAMNSWDSFQREANEKTWLTRIAVNTCKNIMRTNWFRLSRIDNGDDCSDDYVSEKCAVFVAGGIRYTLKGRTSLEIMKVVVDSMG